MLFMHFVRRGNSYPSRQIGQVHLHCRRGTNQFFVRRRRRRDPLFVGAWARRPIAWCPQNLMACKRGRGYEHNVTSPESGGCGSQQSLNCPCSTLPNISSITRNLRPRALAAILDGICSAPLLDSKLVYVHCSSGEYPITPHVFIEPCRSLCSASSPLPGTRLHRSGDSTAAYHLDLPIFQRSRSTCEM